MFENKIINGIHASRYIASWVKSGGGVKGRNNRNNFKKWLISIGLNLDDANYIIDLAGDGKLELEMSAAEFIRGL